MRGTRFVFAGSIVAFLAIAGITIIETAGYHLQFKPFRIQHVAGLSVLATSRSSVFLNDSYIGSTPLRRGTMTPGVYHIRVSREGFLDWEADVRIVGGQAKIIGPLALLPTTPETLSQPLLANDLVLPDTDSGTLFVAHDEGEHIWTIRNLTHQSQTSVPSLEPPTAISASSDGASMILQTATKNIIVTGTGQPWVVAPFSEPHWATISNDVVFGIRNQHLVVLDALQQEESQLELVTSITTGYEALWTTSFSDQNTVLQMRDESTVSNAKTITSLSGDWRLVQTISGQVLLREQTSGKSKILKRQQVGGASLTDLDSGDTFWQTKTTDPLIWRHGSELMTLNQKQRPLFIDRWTNPVVAAWWYVDRDILLWADNQQVIARSILPQTGDRQLAAWDLPGKSTFLLLDQKDAIWVKTATSITRLRWPKP